VNKIFYINYSLSQKGLEDDELLFFPRRIMKKATPCINRDNTTNPKPDKTTL
jgi:hypothetical protein